jgi:formylglycine-generating enzyme required for sulfatase activity
VTITSFQIERYEVTVQQFVAFLNVLGPGGHATGCGGGRCAATQSDDPTSPILYDGETYSAGEFVLQRPMTNVTWFGAQTYCATIGRRIPTEAEWERAARGPEGYIYPWGWTFDSTLANTSRAATGGTMPVGTYPDGQSPFGAEDMAGNVAEWVLDWYQVDFYSTDQARVLNPQGPTGGTERVIRGGAWDQRPFFSRAVHRLSRPPNDQAPWLGFRCVSDENPPPTAAAPAGAAAEEATATLSPTPDPNLTPTDLPTLPPGGN